MELVDYLTEGQLEALIDAARIVLNLHDQGRVRMSAAERRDLADAREQLDGQSRE